jgi:hypothetical protein
MSTQPTSAPRTSPRSTPTTSSAIGDAKKIPNQLKEYPKYFPDPNDSRLAEILNTLDSMAKSMAFQKPEVKHTSTKVTASLTSPHEYQIVAPKPKHSDQ